jgi:hypothetical protein
MSAKRRSSRTYHGGPVVKLDAGHPRRFKPFNGTRATAKRAEVKIVMRGKKVEDHKLFQQFIEADVATKTPKQVCVPVYEPIPVVTKQVLKFDDD